MNVKIDITREDFWQLNKFAMLNLNKYKKYVIAYIAAMPVLLFVAFQVLRITLTFSIVAAIILGAVLDIYFYVRVKGKIMRLPDHKAGILGEHNITLSVEGIKDTTDVNDSFYKWEGIHSVKQDNRYIYIFVNAMAGHIIPKRSFESEEEAQQFYTKAVEWLGQKD